MDADSLLKLWPIVSQSLKQWALIIFGALTDCGSISWSHGCWSPFGTLTNRDLVTWSHGRCSSFGLWPITSRSLEAMDVGRLLRLTNNDSITWNHGHWSPWISGRSQVDHFVPWMLITLRLWSTSGQSLESMGIVTLGLWLVASRSLVSYLEPLRLWSITTWSLGAMALIAFWNSDR